MKALATTEIVDALMVSAVIEDHGSTVLEQGRTLVRYLHQAVTGRQPPPSNRSNAAFFRVWCQVARDALRANARSGLL